MKRFYKIYLRIDKPNESPFRFHCRLDDKNDALVCATGLVSSALLNKEGQTIIQVRECLADDDWDEIRRIEINASGREGM